MMPDLPNIADSPAAITVIAVVLTMLLRDGTPALLQLWKQRSADQVVQADMASKGYVVVIAELKQQIAEEKQEGKEREARLNASEKREAECLRQQERNTMQITYMQKEIDELKAWKLRHGDSDAKPGTGTKPA